ncbi:hypothetical protein ACS0TY_035238 [Phlomoides rotata]
MALTTFVFLATLLTTSFAESDVFNRIQQLQPRFGTGGHRVEGLDCQSWRLVVETNNLKGWKLVPESCEDYIGKYMLGKCENKKHYRDDCKVVANAAIEYAYGVVLAPDGRDVWVFVIDETMLSNTPYYARTDVLFGALPYNDTTFNEWVAEGAAPPVPAIRRLYKTVLSLGFKTVFLTGTEERFKDIRIINLNKAGYYNWEKLFFMYNTI